MATLPNTMSEDDPWAWQAWAAQRDPGAYGWETLDPGFLGHAPRWYADAAGFGGDQAGQGDVHAAMSDEQRQQMADAGYQWRQARGPGYSNLWQVVGPDGKVLDQGGFNRTQSMHGADYALMASVLAAGIGGAAALGNAGIGGGIGAGAAAGAGAGGVSAAEGAAAAAAAGDTAAAWGAGAGLGGDTLAAAGGATNWGAVGNAALRGAALNGGTTAVRGGSLTDILRSAATGAVTGGAGSYVSGLGYSPVVSQAATGAIGAAARGGNGRDIATGAVLGGVNGAMSGWQPTGNQMADSAIRGGITSAVRGGDGQQILTGAANGAIGSLGRSPQAGANPQAGGTTMSDLQYEYGADPNMGGVNYLGGSPTFNEASGGLTFNDLSGGYEGGNLTFDGQGLDTDPSLGQQAGSWLTSNLGNLLRGGTQNQQQRPGGGQNPQGGGSYLDMMGLMLAGGAMGNMMAPGQANTTGQRAAGDANMAIGQQQRDLANQQITQQQQLFQQYQPMLQQLISSSLTSQGQAQGQGQDMWSSYLNTWKPVGEELAARSLEMASPGRIEQQASLAGADAAGRYDRAMGETNRALTAAGANPEKIAALEAAGRLEAARGVAGATATARREGENRSVALLDNAARFGSALPGQALAATQVAGQAGQQASSGFQSLADAALRPATAAAPLLNGAVNANSAAGSLFSNATAAEVASDIAANNSTLGGAGAGLQLWQMMNRPAPTEPKP